MTREDTIAYRVARERKKLGLTQGQLADVTGIGQSTIETIEQGRSSGSLDTLLVLAQAFGMSVEELTGRVKGRSTTKP